MDQVFGDLILSRNSWGSKELTTTFGFNEASKSNLGAVDAADELLAFMVAKQKWVHLGDALTKLSVIVRGWSPTTNYVTLQGELQSLWNEYSAIMDGETPNELAVLHTVIVNIKNDFITSSSVGRIKLHRSFLKHSLNLFKTI